MTYTIFCVFDTEEDNSFEIGIDKTMFMAHLQRAIEVEEPKYTAVASRKFKLYSINTKDINEARSKSQDLSKLKRFKQRISNAEGSELLSPKNLKTREDLRSSDSMPQAQIQQGFIMHAEIIQKVWGLLSQNAELQRVGLTSSFALRSGE